MNPYDAILGFDWLQQHSPMKCDWVRKSLEFSVNGKEVKLKGLQQQPLQLTSISATKVYNSTKGNDIWAFVFQDYISDSIPTNTQSHHQISKTCSTLTKMFSLIHKYYPHLEAMTMLYLLYLVHSLLMPNHTTTLHNTNLRLKDKCNSYYSLASLLIVIALLPQQFL